MPIFSPRPEPAPEGWDVTTIRRTRADVNPAGRFIQGELVPFGTKLLITEQRQDEWHENVAEAISASSVAWGPTAMALGVPAPVVGAIKAGAAALAPEPTFPEFARIQEAPMATDSAGSFDLGGTLIGLANAYTSYRNQRAQSAAASGALALPGGIPTMNIAPVAAGGGMVAAGGRILSALPSFLGGGLTAVGGAIRSVSGKIVGFLVGGRRVSRKSGVALARKVGLEAAAAALGVGALELAQAVLAEEESKARGRGGRAITAAQLRVTRRTIGKVERAHRQIVGFCNSARVPRRRAAPAKRR